MKIEFATDVQHFQQTYRIEVVAKGEAQGAYILGYLTDGEVFFVFVPEHIRRKGIGMALLREADKLLAQRGLTMCFTSSVSPEGAALVAAWKKYWSGLSTKERFARYAVKDANSLLSFLDKYYKPQRFRMRGEQYAGALIESHQGSVEKDGYTIISHHDSVTGQIAAYYP